MKFCPQCASPLTSGLIDGQERKLCSATACGFVVWDNPLPVVIALVSYQDQILLARNAQWPAGRYSFISGYLEKGEAPEQAVVREVKEELGLDAEVQGFIGHYAFLPKNQLLMAFDVTASGELSLGDEIVAIKCLSRDELAAYPFAELALSARIAGDWLASR